MKRAIYVGLPIGAKAMNRIGEMFLGFLAGVAVGIILTAALNGTL